MADDPVAATRRFEVSSAELVSVETHVEIEQKPFTIYRVAVNPDAGEPWVVARRFSEFADLKAALLQIDKGAGSRSVIATQPFPPKCMYGSMQDEVVESRHELLAAWVPAVASAYSRAVALLSFLSDDGSENSTQDLLTAKGYLRGTALRLERPLTGWGTRSSLQKSCFLVGGSSAKDPRQVLSLLTLDAACPVAIGHKTNAKHFKSFLTSIEHAFLMPVTDVGIIPQTDKLLVFRPFVKSGSLSDVVRKLKSPLARAVDKYAAKKVIGVNERLVAMYGRHVLEGMRYLQQMNVRCDFVRCGNVMLREQEWASLSDFENSVLNVAPPKFPRVAERTVEVPTHSQAPPPAHACTGQCAPVHDRPFRLYWTITRGCTHSQ